MSCMTVEAEDTGTDVSREGLAAVDGGAQLVDVRSPEEFAAYHIEGAVNIPMAELAAAAADGRLVAGRAVVLQCRSGARAEGALEVLAGLGFGDVLNAGAVAEWPGASPPAKAVEHVRCGGCGAICVGAGGFEKHCKEVVHDDDFDYTYEPVVPETEEALLATRLSVIATMPKARLARQVSIGSFGKRTVPAWVANSLPISQHAHTTRV